MNSERPGRYDDPSDYELTPEQAQAAYDAAPAIPLSEERIQEIVKYATTSQADTPGPQTHEEARQFHEGFLAGVTAYCAAVGHSCLKSDNPKLSEVFDAQGWKTIEMFEKLAVRPVVCEHGVKDGDWCEACNKESKDAQQEQLQKLLTDTLKSAGVNERWASG